MITAASAEPPTMEKLSPSLHNLPRLLPNTLRLPSTKLRHLLARPAMLRALLPSFLQDPQGATPKPGDTAWLDGMRGVASLFVYFRHFAGLTHPHIQATYGRTPEDVYITQLPIVRLFVSGPAMVSLFFVISGYALSLAPLRALHQDGHEACLTRLSSATFRRAARIFLPGVVVTFGIMMCVWLGLYKWGHMSHENSEHLLVGMPEPPMHEGEPFSVHFWDWVWSTCRWLNVWRLDANPYNPHMWTLGIEFRCSIVLFITLVGLARVRVMLRLMALFLAVVYCHFANETGGWMFFAGSFLAQLRLIQVYHGSASKGAEPQGLLGEKTEEAEEVDLFTSLYDIPERDIYRCIVFVAGLYLMSYPDAGFGM